MKYIISLDQGTTSSRALLFDEEGKIVDQKQKEFEQIFPKPGWVEHDPEEIWSSQKEVFQELLNDDNINPEDILAVGITNQRETTILWDKHTGKPIHNALVWQDKRTADLCEQIKANGHEEYIRKNTGLVVDSYFSATKIMWLLDNVPGAREKAEAGDVLFGTVDSWLIWKMTEGQSHVTDYTNASRSMLFNIRSLEWDQKLLKEFNIPESILPKVQASASDFGTFEFAGIEIPILGVAGDQQAALFGQTCFEKGMAKNTYGTGCFLLMNTGTEPVESQNGLLTTIACGSNGEVNYALEGSIFVAGAAIQWLRDGLKIIDSASQSESLAQNSNDDSLYLVPAFVGLGAPYWDMYARGAIFGLTRGSSREDLVKATLESLAYQTKDVLVAMEEDANQKLTSLQVDGGATANNFLMQFQADILNTDVERPTSIETTATGAAYLAGIKQGLWTKEDIIKNRSLDQKFEPSIADEDRTRKYKGWQKAVTRTLNWEE